MFFSLRTHFFIKQEDLQLHFVSMVTVFENTKSSSMDKSYCPASSRSWCLKYSWVHGMVMVVMWIGSEGFTSKNFAETLWRTSNKVSQILTGKTIFSDAKSNFNHSPDWHVATALSLEKNIYTEPVLVAKFSFGGEVSRNSQDNTCACLFLSKVAGLRSATLFKKRLSQLFSCNFVKF